MLDKILVTGISKIASGLALFLLTLVVARAMDTFEAGVFLWCFAFLSAAVIAFRLGVDSVILREIACRGVDAQTVLYRGLLWIALVVIPFVTIAYLFKDTITKRLLAAAEVEVPLMLMLAALLPMSFYTAISFAFQGQQKLILATFFQNLGIASLFVLIFSIAFISGMFVLDAVAASMIYVFCAWAIFLLSLIAWFRQPETKLVCISLREPDQWRASLNLWIVSVMGLLANWSGIIVAGAYLPSDELAYLSAAQRTAMLVSFVLSVVNMVVTPQFARLWNEGRKDDLTSLAKTSSRIMFLLMLPVALLVFTFPEAVMSLFGSEFVAGAGLLVVMMLGQVVNVLTGSVAYLLSMTGHERDLRSVTLVSGPISIISAVILTAAYGVVGAAAATAIGLSLQNIGALWMVRKRLGFWPVG